MPARLDSSSKHLTQCPVNSIPTLLDSYIISHSLIKLLMLPKLVLLLALVAICTASFATSIFYCGFGGDFCGQSTEDDVNPNAEFVILAFVNTNPDGSITMDEANFPAVYANQWQSNGKKLIISVGGQNGNWNYVFASPATVSTFIASVVAVV